MSPAVGNATLLALAIDAGVTGGTALILTLFHRCKVPDVILVSWSRRKSAVVNEGSIPWPRVISNLRPLSSPM